MVSPLGCVAPSEASWCFQIARCTHAEDECPSGATEVCLQDALTLCRSRAGLTAGMIVHIAITVSISNYCQY